MTKMSQKQLEAIVEHYEQFFKALTPVPGGYEFHDEKNLIDIIELIKKIYLTFPPKRSAGKY